MRKIKITARLVQSLKSDNKRYEVYDIELKGFYLRVSPSAQMIYYQTYFFEGRRQRFKIGDARVLTAAQAREQAVKVLAEAACGRDPKVEARKVKLPTVLEFIKKTYGPWAIENRKSGRSTQKYLQSKIYSDFHSRKLNELNPWLIEKWRTQRRKTGISFSTINRDLGRLRALLYKTVEWEVVSEHPFSKVKQYREDNNRKVRYLSAEEEQALRQALDERQEDLRIKRANYNRWRAERGYPLLENLSELPFADYLKPMVLLSINTGLRRGETFDLRWSDIDFLQKILTVDGERAKSARTRYVPLNQEALETLALWKRQQKEDSKMVFESKDGGRFQDVKKSWAKLLKMAGISSFRWHDMHHHFASRLVMVGVDLNTVRELLGHSDLKMTLRYAHLSPEVKADAVAKLDRGMFRPFREPRKGHEIHGL